MATIVPLLQDEQDQDQDQEQMHEEKKDRVELRYHHKVLTPSWAPTPCKSPLPFPLKLQAPPLFTLLTAQNSY
jgi:hypothetical protein